MPSTTATLVTRRPKVILAVPVAIAAAAVVGVLASAAIAAIAHAAGVSQAFSPLHFATYTSLIVLGVIGGAVGWQVVRSRFTNPSWVLARLVPLVLLLSFIPDIIVGVTKTEHATTWGGVAALMVMHVVVATFAVLSFLQFLPVRSTVFVAASKE